MSFLEAIRCGAAYTYVLSTMLKQKDFDSVTPSGNTDLMVLLGNMEIALPDDFLFEVLKRTNNIDQVNNLGFTALLIAFNAKKVSQKFFEALYKKSSGDIHPLKIFISPYKTVEVLENYINRTTSIDGRYIKTFISLGIGSDAIKELLEKVDNIPFDSARRVPKELIEPVKSKVSLVSESDVIKIIELGDEKSSRRTLTPRQR